VPLRVWCVMPPNRWSGKRLHELLKDWMGGLVWDSYSGKFLDKEGLARMEEEEHSIEKKKESRWIEIRGKKT
jgi:hypothetical protein